MTESPKTFVPRMKQRAKEIRDARKQGKDATQAGFTPVQHLQKVGDIKKELEGGLPTISALLKEYQLPAEALEGAKVALLWILHFDKISQEEQKREHERAKAEREAEKERIKAQRDKEKQQKAVQAKESLTSGW
jgi:uncharacterized membrane protein YukC